MLPCGVDSKGRSTCSCRMRPLQRSSRQEQPFPIAGQYQTFACRKRSGRAQLLVLRWPTTKRFPTGVRRPLGRVIATAAAIITAFKSRVSAINTETNAKPNVDIINKNRRNVVTILFVARVLIALCHPSASTRRPPAAPIPTLI